MDVEATITPQFWRNASASGVDGSQIAYECRAAYPSYPDLIFEDDPRDSPLDCRIRAAFCLSFQRRRFISSPFASSSLPLLNNHIVLYERNENNDNNNGDTPVRNLHLHLHLPLPCTSSHLPTSALPRYISSRYSLTYSA